jgi:hypothetical protein
MSDLEVRGFLEDYKNELNYLVEQFNFNAQKPCDNMPWLIVDKYLNGNFQHDFNKSKISELHEKIKTFKNIISVWQSFDSDFGDLISAISLSSNDYKRNYESYIKRALEEEIEKKLKGKDWTFDKSDLLSNNEYINLYEICKLNLEILSKIFVGFGFKCELSEETVEAIYNSMVTLNQISGILSDFKAIFSNTQTPFKNPVKWLILHNRKPNKTALFTFIKLMLKLDELPREILRQANQLFVCGKGKIFPENYTYPSIDEQKSSYFTHFKQVKQTYFPDFLK